MLLTETGVVVCTVVYRRNSGGRHLSADQRRHDLWGVGELELWKLIDDPQRPRKRESFGGEEREVLIDGFHRDSRRD